MYLKRIILGLATLATLAVVAHAGSAVTGTAIERASQPINFTSDIDLSPYQGVSVQAVYSNGTPTSKSFSDGAKGTASLTVVSTVSLAGQSVTLNGVTLKFGVDIDTQATTAATAKAISDAIVAKTSLQTVVTSSYSASVVYATATNVGSGAISVTSSVPAKLRWNKPSVSGGSDTEISVADDTFTKAAHGFPTGLAVLFTKSAGTEPGNLSANTTYYVIKANDNAFKLATSTSNAVAGTAINISSVTGSGTFSVAPLALVNGSCGFKWQGSNDASNFADLSISSVTYSTAGNTLWDLGTPNYRYLRLNFTAPTYGGIAIAVKINGRKE